MGRIGDSLFFLNVHKRLRVRPAKFLIKNDYEQNIQDHLECSTAFLRCRQ